MKKNFPLPVLQFFILIISSCGLYKDQGYKDVSYYQNLERSKDNQETINNFQPLRIQSGDILGINGLNPEAAAVFNIGTNRDNSTNTDNSNVNPINGFKVDASGQVQLPLIGSMTAAGLTTDEITKEVTTKLQDYLKKPIVNVRILNFKISVLGDVLKPDTYTVQNEHININEALSRAGDLNITAKRTNVLLVREENGKRHFITIDLTKRDLFESPYYYLHNNDIIYVDADKTKYDNIARSYKTNTLVISGISVLAIVISAFFVYHH